MGLRVSVSAEPLLVMIKALKTATAISLKSDPVLQAALQQVTAEADIQLGFLSEKGFEDLSERAVSALGHTENSALMASTETVLEQYVIGQHTVNYLLDEIERRTPTV